jgi:hypothetical protein
LISNIEKLSGDANYLKNIIDAISEPSADSTADNVGRDILKREQPEAKALIDCKPPGKKGGGGQGQQYPRKDRRNNHGGNNDNNYRN